jgi:hypothetical protein
MQLPHYSSLISHALTPTVGNFVDEVACVYNRMLVLLDITTDITSVLLYHHVWHDDDDDDA